MIVLRETMTHLDGQTNVSENEIADKWSQAKRVLGDVFPLLSNAQFYDLKNGEPMELRTGAIHRKIELFERTDAGVAQGGASE